jgi:hypothetical protein
MRCEPLPSSTPKRSSDLLDGRRELERSATAPQCSDRSRVRAEAAKLKDQVQAAIDKYAASFGEKAAGSSKDVAGGSRVSGRVKSGNYFIAPKCEDPSRDAHRCRHA